MARTRRMIIALAGVLVGHQLVHAIPHQHANEAAHGYIPVLAAIVLPAALFALVGLVREGLAEGRSVVRPGQIAAMQVYLFATQELIESMSTGMSVLHFVTDPVMWIGIIVQVGTAWLIVSTLAAIRWMLPTELRPVRGTAAPRSELPRPVAGLGIPRDPQFARLRTRGPPVPVH